MVRVAIDAGPLYGHRTGIGNAVQWALDALNDRDDVDLAPYVLSARARVRPPHRRLRVPAMVAHRLWERSSRPTIDRMLGSPDVVHGTNYVVPPTRCARIVSVYDCWFLDHPDDAHPDIARSGQILRRSIAEGAHVVASSVATADRVRELFDTDRIHTVLLGPPPPQQPPLSPLAPEALRAVPSDVPIVVAIGTIERRKNLPVLVSAFERLAAEHETARLVIAGRPGDDASAVEAAITRAPATVRDRIHVLGAVDDDTKQWLLAHATALAYPSLDEGFGFPLLEAQAAGIAVVASSAGSIPEIAGTGAALFSLPSDADAMAVNLYGVITDETRRSRLIDAGHRNLERFSWSTTAAQLAELYHHISN